MHLPLQSALLLEGGSETMLMQAILPLFVQAIPAPGNWSLTPLHQPSRHVPKTSCRLFVQSAAPPPALRTCRTCKQPFDPATNHPTACQYHPGHFGGETKRKFESVYTGGTMDTPASGQIVQYWHCCGSKDAFCFGCERSPHLSYDD